jgi:hypothetical protein
LEIVGGSGSGNATVAVNGGSFVLPANTPGGGTLNYNLGTVTIAAGANLALGQSDSLADQTVLNVNSLVDAGTLDVGNNLLLVNATNVPLATVAALVNSGRNGGLWTGTGITSSSVVPNSPGGSNYINDGNNGKKTVGYAAAASNNSLPAGYVEVRYTEAADFNLDGTVNLADYLAIQGNYLQTGATFQQGDANGDGVVDLSDYLILQGEYLACLNSGTGLAVGAGTSTAPASIGISEKGAVAPPSADASSGQLFSDTAVAADWLESGVSVLSD